MRKKVNIDVIPYKRVNYSCPICKKDIYEHYDIFNHNIKKCDSIIWDNWYDKKFKCLNCKGKLIINKINW